jgi:signal transduction histidine kinase
MGQRAERRPRGGRALVHAYLDIVRDAAGIAAAPLVELLVSREADGGPRWQSAAFYAPEVARRSEVARDLARSPAAAELPEPRRRAGHRVVACEPSLARHLDLRDPHEVFLPIATARTVIGWLRVVRDGRPDRATVEAYRALARQASGRLEAEALRRQLAVRQKAVERDVTREKHALAELEQAKDTLAALNLVGTHLMAEVDAQAIYAVICRELVRLGFHSAILTADPGPTDREPFSYAFTSFTPPMQRVTEHALERPLSGISVDPRSAPLVGRVLRDGRTVYTARAREAARQLFGGATDAQVRRLDRVLGLRHVIIAPLRYAGAIRGLLVVATQRLRRSDPEAIDAFALQASIALEKARLFGELREHQQHLESEVERRTRELTRAVRALKELDRRKDNFLANVSHELRTPLVTVLGYTDLLLSEKLGELGARQRDCLRVASSSARRLRSFIDELLEFSRYELTRDKLTFAAFDLRELARIALVSFAPRFHERGLHLRARIAPGTPPAWGDRDRVLQVLMNLLGNAERYCGEDGHVRIAVARGRGGRVEISVSDDGQGIPPEHLDRIFDRLYQVGDAVKQREKGAGLGLGLAIVKSIVEAHGGGIEVRSRVGRGTRFRFALPSGEGMLVQPAAGAASSLPDATPSATSTPTPTPSATSSSTATPAPHRAPLPALAGRGR